jgi:phosphoserine aminotransferase
MQTAKSPDITRRELAMKKIRLYTPGPCAVPEEVMLEMARPFEHHRTPWFTEMMTAAQAKLKQVMCTDNEVVIVTGSGTAAAEGVIIGCHPARLETAHDRGWQVRTALGRDRAAVRH